MSQREPDWKKLEEIADEMDRLIARGEWTRAAFERLTAEGEKASPDCPQYFTFLLRHADQSWFSHSSTALKSA